jgi:hypothetical protein
MIRLLLPAAFWVATPLVAQLPTLTRVGEIGCSDCATAAQFSTINDVAATDSGGVLVVGTEAPALRMFDRSGKVLWTSGRSGTGPGEYRMAIRAAVSPRGVQVVDMTLRRITRLDAQGTVLGSAPVSGFPAAVGVKGRSGEIVVLLDDFRGTFSLQRWGVADSGSAIGTVPRSPAAQSGALTIPSIAVDAEGRLAVLRDPNEYRIIRMSADGRLTGEMTRDIPRVKRTAGEIAAIERRRAASREKMASERGRSGGSPPLLRPRADELKPHVAINGLRYDDTGRLWVKTMRGNESSTVFDLFASDGRYLGELTVPAAIGTFSIAGRWFVADFESDDGTPRIGIWQLR